MKKSLLGNEKVCVKCIEKDLKLFLSSCDNFMSLTLFLKDGHYDDSQILIGKDENARKWASSLIQYILDKNGVDHS